MENGSLEEWLHPFARAEEVIEAPKTLSLVQRLDVFIDVASALDYLHNHCETPIVHCDLKPSNVLLDSDMTGHVSDFGLSRFLKDPTPSVSGNQSSSIGIKGTVGYAAPEYGMGGDVSTYGDVYSFGILLLEMFTGKKPTDHMFSDNLNLHNYVKSALPGRTLEISESLLLQGTINVVEAHRHNRLSVRVEKTEEWLALILARQGTKPKRDRFDTCCMERTTGELNVSLWDSNCRVRTGLSRSPSGLVSDFPIVALLALTVSIDRQVIKKSKLGNISSSGDAGALIRLVKKSGRAPFSFLIREVARPAHTVFTFVPSSPPC
ncbi:hypothetical protein ACLB2K_072061 [Fragaria x ananassa]